MSLLLNAEVFKEFDTSGGEIKEKRDIKMGKSAKE